MFHLILFLLIPLISHAAHFEGGSMTYKIINSTNSTVSIMISQTYIYVYPSIYCNNSYIINQSPQLNMAGRDENGKYLNCTANCTTSGGYVSVPLNAYCTDYSTAMSITIGERRDIVNISKESYFVVAFASNNWRPLTLPPGNSGSKAWSLSCTIDLRSQEDGTINNPPVAAIISPIYIPVGIQQAIFIPTIDADNDQVRCRFAVNGSNECADVCPPASLPNGTILLSNCTLLITGMNVSDWYAVALVIEDFLNSTSNTPLSSIPVQFLINVRSVSSCSMRSLLTGPVSQTGQCVGIQVGQTYAIQLIAENFCPNTTIIADIATLSFPVMTKTPIVRNTTTLWSISLAWTPTASAVGSQVLCAVAIDSANVQSNQYCMTFTVAEGSLPTCPGQMEMTTQIATYTTSETSHYTSSDMITTFTSGSILTTSESVSTSINPSSQFDTSSSTDTTTSNLQQITYPSSTSFLQSTTKNTFETSLTMLQQSTNVDTTSSSPASSSSDFSNSWLWIIALVGGLALIFLGLCLCCHYCCPLYYLCDPSKRRRKRSPSNEFPQENNLISPPIYSYMIYNSSENISNDMIPTSRPASSLSTHNTDDIQLLVLSTPKNQIKSHYILAINRSAQITPTSSSLPNVSS